MQLMRLGLETLVVNTRRNYRSVKSSIELNNIRQIRLNIQQMNYRLMLFINQLQIHTRIQKEKYTKDLEVLNAELDKVSKEINKKIQEREAVAEEAKREDQLLKHKEEIKGIVYDIKRVDKAIEKEDKFLNRPEVLALNKALARRYQHKLSRKQKIDYKGSS